MSAMYAYVLAHVQIRRGVKAEHMSKSKIWYVDVLNNTEDSSLIYEDFIHLLLADYRRNCGYSFVFILGGMHNGVIYIFLLINCS